MDLYPAFRARAVTNTAVVALAGASVPNTTTWGGQVMGGLRTALVVAAGGVGLLAVVLLALGASAPAGPRLLAESAILAGLAPGAVFPFLDTTPHSIIQTHIAVTDAAERCSAGAAAPSNLQVLVGEAGVKLVNVMTAATNTGISTTPGQCVFHVTIKPGAGGVPTKVTDVAVRNAGSAALTGVNTITVSAEVR